MDVMIGKGKIEEGVRLSRVTLPTFSTWTISPVRKGRWIAGRPCHRCMLKVTLAAEREQRGTQTHFSGKQL